MALKRASARFVHDRFMVRISSTAARIDGRTARRRLRRESVDARAGHDVSPPQPAAGPPTIRSARQLPTGPPASRRRQCRSPPW